jgi:holliday junction DNA helicase RuvA
MIAYIKGEITHKNPAFVVVEAAGLGYHIHISLHTYAQIEKLEVVKLLIHQVIKEDAHLLYGFASDAERSLFRLLLSVTGVGPTSAQLVLSALSPDELRAAIVGENEATFKRVRGIGPKTAKRIILDLKDKVIKDGGEEISFSVAADGQLREEALAALVSLGFARPQVQRVLNTILRDHVGLQSAEQLIKLALRELS